MINSLNIISIKILNSHYRFMLNIIASFIIYICFIGNFNNTVYCTNEGLPIIAEPKVPPIKGTVMPSVLQVEVNSFLDSAKTMTDQKNVIAYQKMQIVELNNSWKDTNLRKFEAEQKYDDLIKEATEISLANTKLHNQLADQKSLYQCTKNGLTIKQEEINAKNVKIAALEEKIKNIEGSKKIAEESTSTLVCAAFLFGLAVYNVGAYLEGTGETVINGIGKLLRLKK